MSDPCSSMIYIESKTAGHFKLTLKVERLGSALASDGEYSKARTRFYETTHPYILQLEAYNIDMRSSFDGMPSLDSRRQRLNRYATSAEAIRDAQAWLDESIATLAARLEETK